MVQEGHHHRSEEQEPEEIGGSGVEAEKVTTRALAVVPSLMLLDAAKIRNQ